MNTPKHVKYESSCREHLLCIHPLIDPTKKHIQNCLKQIVSIFMVIAAEKKKIGKIRSTRSLAKCAYIIFFFETTDK
jgi:hypothetical protein